MFLRNYLSQNPNQRLSRRVLALWKIRAPPPSRTRIATHSFAMRFRLATKPPLRPLRAWFDIPDDESDIDVLSLKSQICSRIPQLNDEDGSVPAPEELVLSLDDFELLEDSNVRVIKENEVVCIKKKPIGVRKRKAEYQAEMPQKKPRVGRKPTKPQPSPSSSSDSHASSSSGESSSEESSSSDSSSESESESESESSSDSDSSESSESSIEVQSSKPNQTNAKPPLQTVYPSVPPGQGKTSTRNRNARRRAKRIHDKLQDIQEQIAEAAVPSGSANAIPLGPRPTESNNNTTRTTVQTEHVQVQQGGFVSPDKGKEGVSTLKNKNKKKGFKKAMEGIIPEKIVFTATGETSVGPTETTTPRVAEVPYQRLVTPSEKQALGLLPPNMFVTSVEVEGNSWNKKKKKEQRNTYGYDADDDSQLIHLNYGESENNVKGVDWDDVERKWDSLSIIVDVSSLKTGTLVGWKALDINPSTCTPEIMVHIARIKEIKNGSITFATLLRPGSGEVGFGAYDDENPYGDSNSGEILAEDEFIMVDDFAKLQCRVI